MSNACKLTHRISSGLYEARHCKLSRIIFSAFLRFQLRARRYRFRQASVAYSKERPVSGPSAARRSWTWQFTHKFLSSTAIANLSQTRRLNITKTRLLRSVTISRLLLKEKLRMKHSAVTVCLQPFLGVTNTGSLTYMFRSSCGGPRWLCLQALGPLVSAIISCKVPVSFLCSQSPPSNTNQRRHDILWISMLGSPKSCEDI